MTREELNKKEKTIKKAALITWLATIGFGIGTRKLLNPKLRLAGDLLYLVGAMAYSGLTGSYLTIESLKNYFPEFGKTN